MRKLVTVRRVAAVNPIEGADAIEVATVDGWKLVVKKNEFAAGDPCVYFEIDSFLPEADPRYAFLMRSSVREFEGNRGHKLRTIRLRGQISQGLALRLDAFPEILQSVGVNLMVDPDVVKDMQATHGIDVMAEMHRAVVFDPEVQERLDQVDLAELLGIKKWEPVLPANLAGKVRGLFPSFIRKTDQERCQNLIEDIFSDVDARYEVTVKLDGTSFTAYARDGDVGVCSRNLELKLDAENADNTLVKTFNEANLGVYLPAIGDIAIQGELMGEGIQGNREAIKGHKLFIFDAQDLSTGEYLTPAERMALMTKLLGTVNHVPILYEDVSLRELGITNVDELLAFAEGPSLNHPVREGVVFKRLDGKFSFKAISNAFLVKEKD
jgi:RNA ligase (TIGR02306 family)